MRTLKVTTYPRYLFWNYSPKAQNLPERAVVRRVLLYGCIEDMLRLCKEVSPARLQEVADELRSRGRCLRRANFIEKILIGKD